MSYLARRGDTLWAGRASRCGEAASAFDERELDERELKRLSCGRRRPRALEVTGHNLKQFNKLNRSESELERDELEKVCNDLRDRGTF